MIIRIIEKSRGGGESGWKWHMENHQSSAVCQSENSQSIDGYYSRKATALKSAWRFIDNFLDRCGVEIMDGFTGKSLGSRNMD
jgi:hypothetical protein